MTKPDPTHRVVCQNDAGQQRTVTVTARTDQAACNAALKTLNTWRAMRVTPVKGQPQ